MPVLTRKRVNDRPETWHIHYAGVRVGVIVERSGAPPSSDQWQWCCGFYLGSNPGDDRHGTAADFGAARARNSIVPAVVQDWPTPHVPAMHTCAIRGRCCLIGGSGPAPPKSIHYLSMAAESGLITPAVGAYSDNGNSRPMQLRC